MTNCDHYDSAESREKDDYWQVAFRDYYFLNYRIQSLRVLGLLSDVSCLCDRQIGYTWQNMISYEIFIEGSLSVAFHQTNKGLCCRWRPFNER